MIKNKEGRIEANGDFTIFVELGENIDQIIFSNLLVLLKEHHIKLVWAHNFEIVKGEKHVFNFLCREGPCRYLDLILKLLLRKVFKLFGLRNPHLAFRPPFLKFLLVFEFKS